MSTEDITHENNTPQTQNNSLTINTEFENIVPWNGANDRGRDVRLKWERNFDKIKNNFLEILKLLGEGGFDDKYLRKDMPDLTNFLLKLLGGIITTDIKSDDFLPGALGTGYGLLKKDSTGKSYFEVDKLFVRLKAIFAELEVMELTYSGGNFIFGPAGARCTKVEEYDEYYRCYFTADDGSKKVKNKFRVDDQVQCRESNIEEGVHENVSNKYYWRLCVGVGDDYIDLSKSIRDMASDDSPAEGDSMVTVGNQKDVSRQNVIIISVYGEGSPSITRYQGINSFSLEGKIVKIEYYDASTGRYKDVTYGDKYIGAPDRSAYFEYISGKGLEISGLNVGVENLLLNTGFTGDYETIALKPNTRLDSNTQMYSANLKHWTGEAVVSEDTDSASGYSVAIGELSQPVRLIDGERYVLSFKAKGSSVTVNVDGSDIAIPLTSDYQRCTHLFTAVADTVVRFKADSSNSCTICEIKLERGTIATDWCHNVNDPSAVADKFKHLQYLQDALKGKTEIMGGLMLLTQIMLGKYSNDVMEKVTAVLSGIYNDDDDVAAAFGGDLQKAIYTVSLYRDDPTYEPTEEELQNIANCVITHGGRAILNDVILRGYIYALGGVFRGLVYAEGGEFKGRLIAGTVGGKRVVIDPDTSSVRLLDENDRVCAQIMFQEGSGGINSSAMSLIEYDNLGNVIFSTTVAGRAVFMSDTSTGESVTCSPTMIRISQGTKRTTVNKDYVEVRDGDSYSELTKDGVRSSATEAEGKTEDLFLYRDESGFSTYAQFVNGIYTGTKVK